MPGQNEKELLGSDYFNVINDLANQTVQTGAGFHILSEETDFEERYPNAIDDFILIEGVKKIAEKAELETDSLKPPINIPDETIGQINDILQADPLNMNDEELTNLRSTVENIVNSIDIPTFAQILSFLDTYKQFVLAASAENISFPTNTRTIPLVSTDVSLDAFLIRTRIRKLIAIDLNKLVYPYISERYQFPSQLQSDLIGTTGLTGENFIVYTDSNKLIGTDILPGSPVLITNNARNSKDLKQQKTTIEWISEAERKIKINRPLLFDLDNTFVVQIYEYTLFQVLSPGDPIKIPQ